MSFTGQWDAGLSRRTEGIWIDRCARPPAAVATRSEPLSHGVAAGTTSPGSPRVRPVGPGTIAVTALGAPVDRTPAAAGDVSPPVGVDGAARVADVGESCRVVHVGIRRPVRAQCRKFCPLTSQLARHFRAVSATDAVSPSVRPQSSSASSSGRCRSHVLDVAFQLLPESPDEDENGEVVDDAERDHRGGEVGAAERRPHRAERRRGAVLPFIRTPSKSSARTPRGRSVAPRR